MAKPDRSRRDALERRIWRLAFLLTGDARGAVALVDRILDAQPDPGALDPAHLDRLVIQQAREMTRAPKPRRGASPPPGPMPSLNPHAQQALAAALSMPHQPLEAWVLVRIDELDELRMSRAMDCSKTAARTHLAAADDQMQQKLGESLSPAVAALRAAADSMDPGPIIAAHRVQRRKERNRRVGAITVVVSIVVLAGSLALLKNCGGGRPSPPAARSSG